MFTIGSFCVCGLQIFSTNNTECGLLLEEIKCARCSPNAQVLFHSLDMDRMPLREPDLPRLCQDFCREFYYTCRGHIPGNYTSNNDSESNFSMLPVWLPGGCVSKHFHRNKKKANAQEYYCTCVTYLNRMCVFL